MICGLHYLNLTERLYPNQTLSMLYNLKQNYTRLIIYNLMATLFCSTSQGCYLSEYSCSYSLHCFMIILCFKIKHFHCASGLASLMRGQSSSHPNADGLTCYCCKPYHCRAAPSRQRNRFTVKDFRHHVSVWQCAAVLGKMWRTCECEGLPVRNRTWEVTCYLPHYVGNVNCEAVVRGSICSAGQWAEVAV